LYLQELEAAIEKMNTYNAWEIDAEAKRILEAVGIPAHLLGVTVSKVISACNVVWLPEVLGVTPLSVR
jgi:hypothetical protein